jgi:hypothetical protein
MHRLEVYLSTANELQRMYNLYVLYPVVRGPQLRHTRNPKAESRQG